MTIVRIALAAFIMYFLPPPLGMSAGLIEEQENKDTEYLFAGEKYELNSVFCREYHALDDYLIEMAIYGLLSSEKKFKQLQAGGVCEATTKIVRVESMIGGRFWKNGNAMLFIFKVTEPENGMTWYVLSSIPVMPKGEEAWWQKRGKDRGIATAFPLCL